MKIFLTNLRKYNEGQLIGKWLELPASNEEIVESLKQIGINDECKDYFISDYECQFSAIDIKKNSSIEELNDIANQIAEMDKDEIKVCSTIMKNENCTLDEAIKEKNNRQIIILNSNESNINYNLANSYIEQFYGDVINLDKETLERYFDFTRFGEDLKEDFNIDDDETIAVSNT